VEIYNFLRMPDRSRPLVNQLREAFRNEPTNSAVDLDLALQESYSWLLQTNAANASDALQSLLRQHPDDAHIASRVVAAYLAFDDVTNALRLVEARLAKSPDDVPALNDKAMVLMHSGQSAAALPVLDHVLALTNQPAAHRSRAFARMATQDFAQAKAELDELENSGPPDGMVDYGLALVAGHGSETNSARHYFQLCLSNTPAGGALWQQAKAGLRTLEPAK
jgi:predicted Zn-dependent protease